MITQEEIVRIKSLYAAVISKAIEDAKNLNITQGVKARRWILSEDDGVLSFHWMCETVLGISAFTARRRIAARWNYA